MRPDVKDSELSLQQEVVVVAIVFDSPGCLCSPSVVEDVLFLFSFKTFIFRRRPCKLSWKRCVCVLPEGSRAEGRRRRWSRRRTTWSTSSLWLRGICTSASSGECQAEEEEPRKPTSAPVIGTKASSIPAPLFSAPRRHQPFDASLLLRIMMLSVLKNTKTPVKFWFLKNYLSPTFKVGFLLFFFYSFFFLFAFSPLMWGVPLTAAVLSSVRQRRQLQAADTDSRSELFSPLCPWEKISGWTRKRQQAFSTRGSSPSCGASVSLWKMTVFPDTLTPF